MSIYTPSLGAQVSFESDVATAPTFKVEVVTAFDAVGVTATMLTDTERVTDADPMRMRWERTQGVVFVPTITVRMTNYTGLITDAFSQMWLRVYWGYESDGKFYPYFSGKVRGVEDLDEGEVEITVDGALREVLEARLTMMEAWFDGADTYNFTKSGATRESNPLAGWFIEGHEPRLVEGNWKYRTQARVDVGSTGDRAIAVPHPSLLTFSPQDGFRRGRCVIEFNDGTNYDYWWTNDDTRVFGPESRNSDVDLEYGDQPAASRLQVKLSAAGWDDDAINDDEASPIQGGDRYYIDMAGPMTHTSPWTGITVLNAIEVIRYIVNDLFAIRRPSLTYGYDGAAEAPPGGDHRVPLIDEADAGPWKDAAAVLESDSVYLRGAWPEGTSALTMIQEAMRLVGGSIYEKPGGDVGIAIVEPTEGTAIVLNRIRGSSGQNVMRLNRRSDSSRQLRRCVVKHLNEDSGEDQATETATAGATDEEQERFSDEIRSGWRCSKSTALRAANLELIRRQEPTRYFEADAVTMGFFNAAIFGRAEVVRDDVTGTVVSEPARLTSIEFDPNTGQVRYEATLEPLLEGEQYARFDVDVFDDPNKFMW